MLLTTAGNKYPVMACWMRCQQEPFLLFSGRRTQDLYVSWTFGHLGLSGPRRISLIHHIRCVSGAGLEKGLYLKMTSSTIDLVHSSVGRVKGV